MPLPRGMDIKAANKLGKGTREFFSVLLAGLGLAVAIGTSAEAGSAGGPTTAAVRVTVNIPAFVKLEVLRTISHVTVTQADIERGYVDIPAATELRLSTNSKQGARIMVRASSSGDTASLSGSAVPNLAHRMSGSTGNGYVPVTSNSETIYRGTRKELGTPKIIDYRINLDWGIEAGTYSIELLFTALPND